MQKPKRDQYYYNSEEYAERLEELEAKKQEILEEKAKEAKHKKARARKEIKELKAIFTVERCGEENMHLIESLIDRAGFLRAELESIEATLQKEGCMDFFTQGVQTLWREHPLSKVHAQHSKGYRETIKHLESYLKGTSSGGEEKNPLSDLIYKGNKAREKYRK